MGFAVRLSIRAKSGKFETAAAEIADDAFEPVYAGHDAKRRVMGLLRPGQHLDRDAGNGFDLSSEYRTIGSLTRRRGGDDVEMRDLHQPDDQSKALDRPKRAIARAVRQTPRRGDSTTEAGG